MPLITLTGGIGCGMLDVAGEIARRLDLDLFDDERLQTAALDIGFSTRDLKAFDEKAPGLLDRLLRRSPETYDELMASVIYEVARGGNGVIIGHGSPYFLKDFNCALHVRMRAPKAFRAERVASGRQIERQTALELIEKRDAEMKGFLHFTLKIDWDDLSLYDLVLNIEKIGTNAAASLVVHLAETDAITACTLNAMEAMERFSLQKRVEAALIQANISLQELGIEVPQPGVVKLTGLIGPMRSAAGVGEVVREVTGVKKVISAAERHPMAEL